VTLAALTFIFEFPSLVEFYQLVVTFEVERTAISATADRQV